MKKQIIFFLLLLVSLILTPLSFGVNASTEDTLKIDTYYPEDILDYADLTDIKQFSICDNYIAYTLDNHNLIILNRSNKESFSISNFINIKLIKYANDKIIVVDEDKIYIVCDYTKTSADQLTLLKNNLPTLTAIDIYSNKTKTYIGYIYNNTFELLEYSNSNILTSTPITKTYTSDNYLDTTMIAINNNSAYIVYSSDLILNSITVLNISNGSIKNTPESTPYSILFATLIDTFYYNSKEYVVTFTDHSLFLLDSSLNEKQEIKKGSTIDIENNIFPILSISHLDYYNNAVYISDTYYKTIQSFILESEENNEDNVSLKSDKILLCGNNQAKGRFNNVNNIYVQGDTLFTSDTDNNRIQILTPNKTSIVNMPNGYSSPISICRDNNNILYTVAKQNEDFKILKYTFNSDTNKYNLNKTIEPENTSFKISSITTTNNDVVYGLDYQNNNIFYVNNNTATFKCKFNNLLNTAVDLKEKSKISYLKLFDQFVILNDSQISLHENTGKMLDIIDFTNVKDITVGLSEIYVLSDNKITLIEIEDNKLIVSTEKFIIDDKISKLNTISYDVVNNIMYGFNNNRSCIEYFDCKLLNNQFNFDNINNNTPTTENNTPYIYELTYVSVIYTKPYNLGEYYVTNDTITHAIGIESYGDYIRILFNDNNQLKEGFVNKYKCTKLDYEYSVTNVIAINDIIPIYKYPTLLKLNSKPITCGEFPIYTKITLTHLCKASIDGKTFYMFKKNGEIGFIYSQDIILDTSKSISNLNNENATIRAYDKDYIKILSEDKSSTVYTLKDESRIYVENYDKHCEYTKVIYKDSSLKTYEGYVETKYIEMDELDLTKIILISLISISILILVVIVIIYISIKKKK